MVKNFLFYGVCLAPFLLGAKVYSDILHRNDERAKAVMACMHETLEDDSITAKEAYDICRETNR